jgi:16S rRNA (uracil1498-N3)-methyltransferase
MSERFYVSSPLAPGTVEIDGAEAHHLAAVCRLRPGDPVCLFNGDGREYAGIIQSVSRRRAVVEVEHVAMPERELGFRLEVAAPVPKGDRAQFLIEKLTELGATTYVPLRTARSVVHPRDAKLDKLERYVIEASKQCGRNTLLTLNALTDWSEYSRRPDLPRARVFAHPGGLDRLPAPGQDIAVAVGPEGGFTAEEIDRARHSGWLLVGLGPRNLRVETAALLLAAFAGRNAPEIPS